ncbi:neuronal pentraxin-1-like [Saccoglossus kowalevskii]
MVEVTACIWMKTSAENQGTPVSYAVDGQSNEFTIYRAYNLVVYVKGEHGGATNHVVNDGEWHHVCVTWQSVGGERKLYGNSELVSSVDQISAGETIEGNGSLRLGQEQDSVGGGYEPFQALIGEVTMFNMWSRVLDETEIQQVYADSLGYMEGSVFSWKSDSIYIDGSAVLSPIDIFPCKRYTIYTEEVSWQNAVSSCYNTYGRLAMMNTQSIYKMMRRFILNNDVDEHVRRGFWFGLSRIENGAFVWSDGTPLVPGDFTRWANNQPNNSTQKDPNGQQCAQLWKSALLKWDDDYCGLNSSGALKGYICEYGKCPLYL